MAYHVDDAFKILEDVCIPESQNAKAFQLKESGALTVARQPVRSVVLSAIELDVEPTFVAIGMEWAC